MLRFSFLIGPVCSEEHQLYDNLCKFIKQMCKYDMEQEVLPPGTECDSGDSRLFELDWVLLEFFF